MKRPRKVFGRTIAQVGSKKFVIEMSKTELTVRLYRGRKARWTIPLDRLVRVVMTNADFNPKLKCEQLPN